MVSTKSTDRCAVFFLKPFCLFRQTMSLHVEVLHSFGRKSRLRKSIRFFSQLLKFYTATLVLYTCSLLALAFKHSFAGRSKNEKLSTCLQGGRVTLASGLTLAGGQKISRVYKHNFTGRVTLQQNPGQLNARLHLEGLETSKMLTRLGGLTISGIFYEVNQPAMVALERR